MKEPIDEEELIFDENGRPIIPPNIVREVTGMAKHLDF